MKMLTVIMIMLKTEASYRSFFLYGRNFHPWFRKVRLLVNGLLASMKQKIIKSFALVVSSKDSLKMRRVILNQLRCLKPKGGSSIVMEDTPDIGIFNFKIHDIIDGPLNVLPLHGKKWNIPDYDSIFYHF